MKKILIGVIACAILMTACKKDNDDNAFKNRTVYTKSNTNGGLWGDAIIDIAIDVNGNKWIISQNFGYDDGVSKFDGTNWTTYTRTNTNGKLSHFLSAIAVDMQNNIWVGGNEGLSMFDGTNWTTYQGQTVGGVSLFGISDIVADAQNNIWATSGIGGTEGGIFKFDGNQWTRYSLENTGLTTNYMYSVAVDAQNNKWFGAGTGIAKFDGNNWTQYDAAHLTNGIVTNQTIAITQDTQGAMWFVCGIPGNGSYAYNLNLVLSFDGTNWTRYEQHTITGQEFLDFNSIAIDTENNKWVGGNLSGLFKFDGTKWSKYDLVGLSCIAIDANGKKWIGTNPNGIVVF